MTAQNEAPRDPRDPERELGCSQRVYEVTRKDLPLHCPMDQHSLWNSHPKVYMPIEEQGGRAKCIYCGAEYVLKD